MHKISTKHLVNIWCYREYRIIRNCHVFN